MKRVELLLLGVMVIGVPPVRAQTATLKPSDLVGLWKGDVVESRFIQAGNKKSVGWLRLRPDSLFWQWNTRVYTVGTPNGTYDQVGYGGIAGRWSLACDTVCTLRLVHQGRYYSWGDAQFTGFQRGTPNPDTVGMALLPTVDDSLRWVKQRSEDSLKKVPLSWPDEFIQQVYVYQVTLADQQLTLVEVDRKLQRTSNVPATGHVWLQEATFKRQ